MLLIIMGCVRSFVIQHAPGHCGERLNKSINMVHHLAVGCIVVSQCVDAPTPELFFILGATVLTDEPLSQSTLQNIERTYLFIDHKHLNPKKNARSSFDILASFPEMNKSKLHGGNSWSW
ncbi:hypothetical protein YC2023_014273 [Brassica napus]